LQKLLAEFNGKVNFVPYIKATEKTLVERLSGRWTCKAQGHIFHEKHNPPKRPGVCDVDGSELFQREDDKAETVKRRIQVYFTQTAPLITYFQERGLLSEIDGTQPIEEVTADILVVIKKPK
jgi:adenylate kinase